MSYLLLWSLLAAGAAQESEWWQACRHGAWLHQLACEVRSARYRHRSQWGNTGGEGGVSNSRDSIELLRTALSPPWAPIPSALLVRPCRQFGQRVVPGSLAVLMACERSKGKTVACGVGCEASLVPAASSLRQTFLAPCSLLAVLHAGSRVGPVCRLGGMSVITQYTTRRHQLAISQGSRTGGCCTVPLNFDFSMK